METSDLQETLERIKFKEEDMTMDDGSLSHELINDNCFEEENCEIKEEVEFHCEESAGEPLSKKKKTNSSIVDEELPPSSKLNSIEKEVILIKIKQNRLSNQLNKTQSLLEVLLKQVSKNQELLEIVISNQATNQSLIDPLKYDNTEILKEEIDAYDESGGPSHIYSSTNENTPQEEDSDTIIDFSQNINFTISQPAIITPHLNLNKYKKDKRPCLYCNKYFCHLSTHYQSKHKDEEEIKRLEGASETERREIFSSIMKKSIDKENRRRLGTNKPLLLQRKPRRNMTKIAVCKNCKAYMSVTGLSRHKTKCFKRKVPMSIARDFSKLRKPLPDNLDKEFKKEVIYTMRMDPIGLDASSDEEVLFIAKLWFKDEKDKKTELKSIRNRVSVIMRHLVKLKQTFNNLPSPEGKPNLKLSEIFRVSEYTSFEKALLQLLYGPPTKGTSSKFKPGVSTAFQTAIKAAHNGLQTIFAFQNSSEEDNLLQEFMELFSAKKNSIFVKQEPILPVQVTTEQ